MSAEPFEEGIAAVDGFAAFVSFLGTPLPENPIQALRILRKEAAAEVERLLDFLDALGGDPDLEDGADAEPTLGWPIGGGTVGGSYSDGECEPSLGWTGIVNQASPNRLGHGEDYEKDDADDEDSDPGEESDPPEDGADAEPNGDEQDCNLAGARGDMEEGVAPSREYVAKLMARRGQTAGVPVGFSNLAVPAGFDFNSIPPGNGLSLILIGPNGERTEIDALGYPVAR